MQNDVEGELNDDIGINHDKWVDDDDTAKFLEFG